MLVNRDGDIVLGELGLDRLREAQERGLVQERQLEFEATIHSGLLQELARLLRIVAVEDLFTVPDETGRDSPVAASTAPK